MRHLATILAALVLTACGTSATTDAPPSPVATPTASPIEASDGELLTKALLFDGDPLVICMDNVQELAQRVVEEAVWSNAQRTRASEYLTWYELHCEATVAPEPTSGNTASQDQAIRSAQLHLDVSAYSRSALIDQLVYEGFSVADATFAADAMPLMMGENFWREEAIRAARSHLEIMPFSRDGLIDQLEYEGFSHKNAVYAVDFLEL